MIEWVINVPVIVGIGFLIFLVSWWAIAVHKNHFLSLLMVLESAFLGMLCVQAGVFYMFSGFPFFVLLVLSACEGAMGLAVLVAYVSVHGNDRLRIGSLIKC